MTHDDERKKGTGIAEEVETIVSPVYEVGGSVRDDLMGRPATDYDFSTPRDPAYIERKVREAKKRPLLMGKRFGTIGLMIDKRLVEITTFRVDHYEAGNRKPQVSFVDDITADLSRRDFTINAIARRKGRIIDPFNGRKDIDGKLIRCVGEAATRFREDPLRMLRAARLAAQLGFVIDETTVRAMARKAHRILDVSKERWVGELDRLLMTAEVATGLRYLMDTGLLTYMIPELALQRDYNQNNYHHSHDLWEHTVRVVSFAPLDHRMRWAALLHDIAKPFVRVEKEDRSVYPRHDLLGAEMVGRLGRYLKWSKRRTEGVRMLVQGHMEDDSPLRDADSRAK